MSIMCTKEQETTFGYLSLDFFTFFGKLKYLDLLCSYHGLVCDMSDFYGHIAVGRHPILGLIGLGVVRVTCRTLGGMRVASNRGHHP